MFNAAAVSLLLVTPPAAVTAAFASTVPEVDVNSLTGGHRGQHNRRNSSRRAGELHRRRPRSSDSCRPHQTPAVPAKV